MLFVDQFQRLQALVAAPAKGKDSAAFEQELHHLQQQTLGAEQRALVLQCEGQWHRQQGALDQAARSWMESLEQAFAVRVALDWLELVCSQSVEVPDDQLRRVCDGVASHGGGLALDRWLQRRLDQLPLDQQRLALLERLERCGGLRWPDRQRALATKGRERQPAPRA